MSTHGHTASSDPAGGWSPALATDRSRRSSDAWGLAAPPQPWHWHRSCAKTGKTVQFQLTPSTMARWADRQRTP